MMPFAQGFINWIVARRPGPFKAALLEARPDWFVQNLGLWHEQSYENFTPTGKFLGFEDLATLFTVGRFNRGVIRMDFDEAALLYKWVRDLPKPVQGLEIGRGWGGSTLLLAIAAGESGVIHSVQLDETHDDELMSVARHGGVDGRLRLLIGDSRTIAFDQEVDFVLIDGAREYDVAKSDHLRFGAKVKVGGLIFHHDMAQARPDATSSQDLRKLKQEILTHHAGSVQVEAEAGSLLVLRKTATPWPAF
jgi:predicted O-methyltransferase YrrM